MVWKRRYACQVEAGTSVSILSTSPKNAGWASENFCAAGTFRVSNSAVQLKFGVSLSASAALTGL
ncbi:hypothetical protein D9M71_818070 [compost metagenome]